MQKFSEEEVLNALRGMVGKSGLRSTASTLGVNFTLISKVLNGKLGLTANLALRIGYVHLGDGVYMRTPKTK